MKFGNYKLNDQRIKKHFAFLPITIGGETRWLEWVEYTQEWYKPLSCNWGWYNIKFNN